VKLKHWKEYKDPSYANNNVQSDRRILLLEFILILHWFTNFIFRT